MDVLKQLRKENKDFNFTNNFQIKDNDNLEINQELIKK